MKKYEECDKNIIEIKNLLPELDSQEFFGQ